MRLSLCGCLLVMLATVLGWRNTGPPGVAATAGPHKPTLHTRFGTLDLEPFTLSHAAGGPSSHTRQRQLLTQHPASTELHPHHLHVTWGPLASHATYLLSLHPDAQHPARQSLLLKGLQHLGGAVTSFLPPYTWVVSAGLAAAQWLALQPDTQLVLYPAHLKLAPEWASIASALNLTKLAQQLEPPSAAQQAMLAQNVAAGPGTDTSTHFLGQPRWFQAEAESSSTATLSSSSNSSSTTAAGGQGANPLPRKFLIDVLFPQLNLDDLKRQGLTRPPPWEDPMHYVSASQAATGGAAGSRQWANGTLLPAVAAVNDWREVLQSVAPVCGADVMLEFGSLLVAACPEDLASVLQWLAAQPSVRWLSPHMQLHHHNLDAGVITQTGGLTLNQNALSSSLHPFWQAGIDGSGQVMGSGDSGIDMQNCYFYDANVDFASNIRIDGSGKQYFASTTHRKVCLYVGLLDMVDGLGHGTHTKGTLAGSKYRSNSVTSPDGATGIAPNAKIAFLDLASGQDAKVWTPADLNTGYFPRTYQVGARIHSDSWGGGGNVYDSMCASVDLFTWNNQDFTSMFAAGNYGDVSGSNSLTSTITSPAVSKNCIAVGATLSLSSQFSTSGASQAVTMQLTIPVAGGASSGFQQTELMVVAPFGPAWSSLGTGALSLVAASPADACGGLNSASVGGKVVVATRSGSCSAGDKARQANQAGALGIILANENTDGFFYITDGSNSVTAVNVPVGGVPVGMGRLLWYATSLGQASGATVSFSARGPIGSGYDQLASFSSFGTTADGRFKPDIVAPGVLLSALSDSSVLGGSQTCGTGYMRGTSMATPVASGAAALIRQYFMSGFYPTGAAVPANVFAPSGPLVKAVLLAGAASLLGNVQIGNPTAGGLPLESPPSARQGWGRVDLSGSLPLIGSSRGWRLQVVDLANLTQGQSHRYCVRASGGPLRVLLVWHDYPGDPAAATALVNNLDLEVRAAGFGGLSQLGNGFNDTLNNVESVLIDSVPEGAVAITVTGTRVTGSASPQPYALVVLGAFTGALQSPRNPVGGGDTTTGSCVIVQAVIIDALSTVSTLTSNSNLEFFFTTASGATAASGFLCQLVDVQGHANLTGTHTWKTCTSPTLYPKLSDATYVFQVRATGEDVADSRTMTIDTRPPVTQISASLQLTPAPVSTSTDNITFTFSAVDASAVAYSCSVTMANGANATYFRSLPAPGLALGVTGPCSSPLALQGLYYGDWTLAVQATDAAGNVEVTGPVLKWQQRYTAGEVYARFATAPPLVTNNASLAFSMYAFTGVASGPPTLANSSTTSWQYNTWKQGNARPTTQISVPAASFVVNATSDGVWLVNGRVESASAGVGDSTAIASITVDTIPPVLVIQEQPSPFSSTTLAVVKFVTTPADDAKSIDCRWLSSTTGPVARTLPDSGTTAYSACNSTGSSSATVTDGWWLFQVRATDAAGNTSPTSDVAFLTDLDPPKVTSITYPAATQSRAATINYVVTDGPIGSGISNMSCSMRLIQAVTPASSRLGPDPGPDFPPPPLAGQLQIPCPQPAKYGLVEGRYMFSLKLQDNAGLRTQVDYTIVLDLQPPVTRVTTPAQASGSALPSQFTLNFSAKDLPDSGNAGVATSQIMLTSATAGSPPSPPSVLVPAPGNSSDAVSASSPNSGRRLLQSPPRYLNGSDVEFGTWQNTTSPVTFQNFVSGSYSLQVRSIDAAGNVGNATDAWPFRVDATLPINPSDSGSGSGSGWPISRTVVGIIAGIGGALLILVVVAVICVRRKAAARKDMPWRTAQQPLPLGGGGARGSSNSSTTPQPMYYGNPVSPQIAGARSYQSSSQTDQAEAHRRWEEDRVARAIAASMEDDKMARAMEASRRAQYTQNEDASLDAAIRASLASLAAQQANRR